MTVTVRLFAILRQHAGRGELQLELAEGSTAADAVTAVGDATGITELLDRMPLALAVNRSYADETAVLTDGDELALVPPVSGGAHVAGGEPLIHASITGEPLSLDRVAGLVGHPGAGAIVTFQGTTRDVERLEYEAHAEMAEELLASILTEIAAEHDLKAIACEHRTGSVPLGDPSVIVAASSAHRPEAFAAARAAIDRIKAELPIWKQEVDGERSEWVEGTPVSGASE